MLQVVRDLQLLDVLRQREMVTALITQDRKQLNALAQRFGEAELLELQRVARNLSRLVGLLPRASSSTRLTGCRCSCLPSFSKFAALGKSISTHR